jgi:hypothetical protein
MLLVEIPWADRGWALPCMTALCPSERYCKERGRAHRKLTDRARQMLLLVARWLPAREIVVTASSSFAALELLEAGRDSVTVVTRLRLDAALYEPAPARHAGQTGRPRKKGKRLATRQIAMALVVMVIEGQFLLAMRRGLRVSEVEDNRRRGLGIAGHKVVHERLGEAVEIGAGHAVVESGAGRCTRHVLGGSER